MFKQVVMGVLAAGAFGALFLSPQPVEARGLLQCEEVNGDMICRYVGPKSDDAELHRGSGRSIATGDEFPCRGGEWDKKNRRCVFSAA